MSVVLDLRVHTPGLWEDMSVKANDLTQATAANQPPIFTPGHWGSPEYDFDGAAAPNSDHLFTTTVADLKTQQGTVMTWFSPDDFTVDGTLWSMTTDGATDDELYCYLRGTVAGDPIDIVSILNGGISYLLRTPINIFYSQLNLLVVTSDSTTIRCYVNGQEVALTVQAGANNGDWFADALDADVFSVGVLRRAALTLPLDGKISKLVVRDDCVSGLEIAKLWQSSAGGWHRQYAS